MTRVTVKGVQEKIVEVLTPFVNKDFSKPTGPKFWEIPGIDPELYYFSSARLKEKKKVMSVGSDYDGFEMADGKNGVEQYYITVAEAKKLKPMWLIDSEVGYTPFAVSDKDLKAKKPFYPEDEDELEINLKEVPRAWYSLFFTKDTPGEFRVGCQTVSLEDIETPEKIKARMEAYVGTIDTEISLTKLKKSDEDNWTWRIRYEAFVAAAPLIRQIHDNFHGLTKRKRTTKKTTKKAARKRR
jgi:hypothetical protein